MKAAKKNAVDTLETSVINEQKTCWGAPLHVFWSHGITQVAEDKMTSGAPN